MQYLVAVDGTRSRMRRELGVRMIGQGRDYDSVNILFNADLRPWTADGPVALRFVAPPAMRARRRCAGGGVAGGAR